MILKNYYQLLNIQPHSNLEVLKKAFRKEISLYHPENNTSLEAKEKFDLLIEAFDILSHPGKRKAYDKMLLDAKTNKPVLISSTQEETYQDWKKEAKKKSKKYSDSTLAEVLLFDLFLDFGFSGMLDGLGDTLGDVIDDVFDIF